MAVLIPKNLASRGGVRASVQDVARLLRDDADDDITVVWNEDDPDDALWVIDPSGGITCALHVLDGGRRSMQKRLAELLGREPRIDEVYEAVGKHAQRVAELASDLDPSADVKIASLVAMPSVSTVQFTSTGHGVDRVLLAEDLRADVFLDALRGKLTGSRPRRLGPRVEKTVRAAITPEIIIRGGVDGDRPHRRVAFRAPEVDDGDVMAVLDRRQQELAMYMGDGYRVIRGVAGSGKSIVLAHRARHLAKRDSAQRILLTCFNIVLGRAMAAELADLPNVDVMHIDSLAYRALSANGRQAPKGANGRPDFVRQREVAKDLLSRQRGRFAYDAVLVDEAQDFDPVMLDLAWSTLAGDDFVVALDGAQNIYRKLGRWNPPGMTARGRSTILNVNYRNTHEILDLAYHMLTSGNAHMEMDDDGITADVSFVEPEVASRKGEYPVVHSCMDVRAEIDSVCDQLEEWHAGGVDWSDMLVLFGNQGLYQGKLYYECRRREIPYYCISFSNRNKKAFLEAGDVVRSSTVQAIKGIEFGHVALCGVNQMFASKDVDDVGQRRMLYVGMTRATDKLFVTVSGSGQIGADLLATVG